VSKRTKLLSEELEYVAAQRNYTLAQKNFRVLKKREGVSEEELERAKARLDKFKEKALDTSAALSRAGLSKGSI
jgi:hypothetical protein